MKSLLLILPFLLLSPQEKTREELLVNYWVLKKITLNGEEDPENFPVNGDWMEFRGDGTFTMRDMTNKKTSDGFWKIIGTKNLSLHMPDGNERIEFEIMELTNKKFVYQLPISKGVLRLELKAEKQ